MNKLSTIEKIEKYLFKRGDDIIQLDETESGILRRIEDGFTKLLDKPEMGDKELRDYLMKQYGIQRSQAYIDINNIKSLLGNVQNAAKEWHRYTVIKWAKELYEKASKNSELDVMAQAINLYGKYTKCDKDEIELPNWDKIIPPEFEPTMDPKSLGIKPIENKEEYINRLRKKHNSSFAVEDATLADD
jgi:hypothetical protein